MSLLLLFGGTALPSTPEPHVIEAMASYADHVDAFAAYDDTVDAMASVQGQVDALASEG